MSAMSEAGALLLCADQSFDTLRMTFGIFPILLGLLLMVIGKPLSAWSFAFISKLMKGKVFQRPGGLFACYVIVGVLLICIRFVGVLMFTVLC